MLEAALIWRPLAPYWLPQVTRFGWAAVPSLAIILAALQLSSSQAKKLPLLDSRMCTGMCTALPVFPARAPPISRALVCLGLFSFRPGLDGSVALHSRTRVVRLTPLVFKSGTPSLVDEYEVSKCTSGGLSRF